MFAGAHILSQIHFDSCQTGASVKEFKEFAVSFLTFKITVLTSPISIFYDHCELCCEHNTFVITQNHMIILTSINMNEEGNE